MQAFSTRFLIRIYTYIFCAAGCSWPAPKPVLPDPITGPVPAIPDASHGIHTWRCGGDHTWKQRRLRRSSPAAGLPWGAAAAAAAEPCVCLSRWQFFVLDVFDGWGRTKCPSSRAASTPSYPSTFLRGGCRVRHAGQPQALPKLLCQAPRAHQHRAARPCTSSGGLQHGSPRRLHRLGKCPPAPSRRRIIPGGGCQHVRQLPQLARLRGPRGGGQRSLWSASQLVWPCGWWSHSATCQHTSDCPSRFSLFPHFYVLLYLILSSSLSSISLSLPLSLSTSPPISLSLSLLLSLLICFPLSLLVSFHFPLRYLVSLSPILIHPPTCRPNHQFFQSDSPPSQTIIDNNSNHLPLHRQGR